VYNELENELFCNIYYLRHLCDTTRFPNWPVKNHIELLKDILDEWKKEVDKKPETLSVDEACGFF
jgi:DnaJ family protein C protein 13